MLALLLACACWTGPQGAVTFPDPPLGTAIVDEAALLSADDRRRIDALAGGAAADAQIPIRVVTLRSLASRGAGHMALARYARLLFDRWALGTRTRNRGLLVVVSHGDRRMWIEPGAGWGGRKTAEFQAVVDRLMVPRFKRGAFGEGIVLGVSGLDALARDVPLPATARRSARRTTSNPMFLVLLVGGLLVGIALAAATAPGRRVLGAIVWPAHILMGGFVVARSIRAPGGGRRRRRLREALAERRQAGVTEAAVVDDAPARSSRSTRIRARAKKIRARRKREGSPDGCVPMAGGGAYHHHHGHSWTSTATFGGFSSGGFSGGGFSGGGGFGGGGGAGGSW